MRTIGLASPADAAQVIDEALHVLKTERLGSKPTVTDTEGAIDRLREFRVSRALSLVPT